MKFQCVYSLGVDCRCEKAISQLGLKAFSYVFGNINSKTISNVTFSIKDNFRTLLDTSYHVHMSDLFPHINVSRTFHTKFDNIKDPHDTTFVHHDMRDITKQEHFKHAIHYFNIIKKTNIPTLYICNSRRTLNTSLSDCLNLVDTIHKLNPNSYCLIMNLQSKENISKITEKYYADSKCSIFFEHIDLEDNNIIRLKELISKYNFDNLITKKDLLNYDK